ncbi:MAG: LacI family DNA-binding transcriptional regulator [Candidatus Ratteibacteria bacterium]|jgi:DNA-binding LacI/PurR family transcriptional regulator
MNTQREKDFFNIKFEIDLPLNVQLKNHLISLIRKDLLKVGDRLPTVYELAELVGVSSATTRRVIGDLVREGYLKATPALGTFVIDRFQQEGREVPQPQGSIGILFPHVQRDVLTVDRTPWTWEILTSMQEEFSGAGYFCTLFPIGENLEEARKIVFNNSHYFAGFISFPDTINGPFLDILEKSGKPYVAIEKWRAGMRHNYVSCDSDDLGRKAARHLVETGCHSFIALYPSSLSIQSYYTARKIIGFQEELLRLNVPISSIKIIDEAPQLEKIVNQVTETPCGIFVASDALAINMVNICREQKKNIPNDIRIVSDAGTMMCEQVYPALTVIRQPMKEMGRETARMLIKLFKSEHKYMRGIELSGKLIVRGTTVLKKRKKEPLPQFT